LVVAPFAAQTWQCLDRISAFPGLRPEKSERPNDTAGLAINEIERLMLQLG